MGGHDVRSRLPNRTVFLAQPFHCVFDRLGLLGVICISRQGTAACRAQPWLAPRRRSSSAARPPDVNEGVGAASFSAPRPNIATDFAIAWPPAISGVVPDFFVRPLIGARDEGTAQVRGVAMGSRGRNTQAKRVGVRPQMGITRPGRLEMVQDGKPLKLPRAFGRCATKRDI
jgi:hypothetical protein